MVLLGAYGNFQDRVVLGLGSPPGGRRPAGPIEVTFAPGAFQSVPILPEPTEPPRCIPSGETVVERDPEWSELTYEELQSRLEGQRGRTPRLPVPTWDEVKKSLPPAFAARPTRIVWNLVCSGYVPELAVPWSVSTRTMWAEAKPDRVFEESLFWVQTRAVRCNYCMGHCEMLLEVAGLDKAAVAERTRRLAGDDWSCFPPAEQRAYALRPQADEDALGAHRGRLQGARRRPRPREGDGDLLVALPRPLHDPRLRRLPAPAGARQRLPRVLRGEADRGRRPFPSLEPSHASIIGTTRLPGCSTGRRGRGPARGSVSRTTIVQAHFPIHSRRLP